MNSEVRSSSDTTNKEEDGVQAVEDGHDHGVGDAADECSGDEVEESEHAEDCDEHVVVDNRRVTGVSLSDHVTDQGHDEECPDELEHSHNDVDHACSCHCDGVVGCLVVWEKLFVVVWSVGEDRSARQVSCL